MRQAQITYIESTGLFNVTLLNEKGTVVWSQDDDQYQATRLFIWCADWVKHGIIPTLS